MRRREFITLLGGAAVWPLAARAQSAMQAVGFLGSDSPDQYVDRLRAFRQGLKEAGYIDGQNLAIEYRWAQGRNDQLPALAADLVRGQLAVIVASTTPSVLALKAATKTIPILGITDDMLGAGLVNSLARPDGNTTGVSILARLRASAIWFLAMRASYSRFSSVLRDSEPCKRPGGIK